MSRIEKMMIDGLSIHDLVDFHNKCQELNRSWRKGEGRPLGGAYDENMMRHSFAVPPYGTADKDPIFYLRNISLDKDNDSEEGQSPTEEYEKIIIDAFSHIINETESVGLSDEKKFDAIMELCKPRHELLDEIIESKVYKVIFSSAEPIADTLIHMHSHAGGYILKPHQEKPWAKAYYAAFRVFIFSTISYFLIRYMDESKPDGLNNEVKELEWKISNLNGIEKHCLDLSAALSAGVINADECVLQSINDLKDSAKEKRMEVKNRILSMSMRLEKFDVRNPETAFLRRMAKAFMLSSRDKHKYTGFIRYFFEAYIDDYDSDCIKQVIKDHKKRARIPADIMEINIDLSEAEIAMMLEDWQAE